MDHGEKKEQELKRSLSAFETACFDHNHNPDTRCADPFPRMESHKIVNPR